jgi:PAS domain S-box-containing protein
MHQEEIRSGMLRVLVIDSAPIIRKRLISNIGALEELTVLEADSIEVAFDKITHFQPLIILYDPGMYCSRLVDFISKTRAEGQNYNPFLIALSQKRDDFKSNKELLLRLSEQQSLYRSLFELSSNPFILVRSDDLQIIEANRAASDVYGYSPDEFLHKHVDELVADPLKAKKVIRERIVFEATVNHRKKDGRLFPASVSYSYITKNSRELLLISVTDMSIAEKRTAEHQAFARLEGLNGGQFGYHHLMATLKGEENERRRISHEIHDHSGQLLVSAKLKTEELMHQLSGLQIHSEITHLRDKLTAAISSLRKLAGNLNSDLLPCKSLDASIEKLVGQLNSKLTVTCLLEPVEPELTDYEKSHMYRIAEEALHNAMKHSPGRSAELSLQQKNDNSIAMRIFSHGVKRRGCLTSRGMGLRTMQQRGELIGGKVRIEASTKGFTVELRLPINKRKKTCNAVNANVAI